MSVYLAKCKLDFPLPLGSPSGIRRACTEVQVAGSLPMATIMQGQVVSPVFVGAVTVSSWSKAINSISSLGVAQADPAFRAPRCRVPVLLPMATIMQGQVV